MVERKHKQYKVILADPPWDFKTYSRKGRGKTPDRHYPLMSLDEIKKFMDKSWLDDNCVLFLWVTDWMLEKAFDVISAWGFTYKTVGFYWVKQNDSGKYPIGLGFWTRYNPELCLLATRGKPKPQSRSVRKLIIAPSREHSRKPDEQYSRIEELCDGPYLELFARTQRKDWDVIGNDVKWCSTETIR